MTLIPTPLAASISKSSAGQTNTSYSDGVLKFMGCSVVSCNMNLGFNSNASSVTVSMVEDTEAGDSFTSPAVPSLHGFSLPKGGVGQPVMYPNDDADLSPSSFNDTDVPFYFCGLLSNKQKDLRNINGKLINVTLVDPREVLTGVQCLLGGWALSQEIGSSAPRYDNVLNVIDCFGYFDHGYESEKNEYGMPWHKIMESIEGCRVKLYGINFEFVFTGDAFTNTPYYYRIDDEIIDLIGLCQKVAQDGGSELITVARKTSSDACVVELRAVKRTATDQLTESEINSFISARTSIIEEAKISEEFRNEKTSAVVIGGLQNENYVAWPTTYRSAFHGTAISTSTGTKLREEYQAFPELVEERLFVHASGMEIGGIFPFFGMSPSGDVPMMEPLITLDHWAFSSPTIKVHAESDTMVDFDDYLPWVRIYNVNKQVRTRAHDEMFLDGDGDSDYRPWGRYDYSATDPETAGWTRGLPLNTIVMQASLVSQQLWEAMYSLYYPTIAEGLLFETMNWEQAYARLQTLVGESSFPTSFDNDYFMPTFPVKEFWKPKLMITSPTIVASNTVIGLDSFRTVVFDAVKKYSDEHMGREFIVCLPKSNIMHKIWNGDPVPTRIEKPEIEYETSDRGWWAKVPAEFDGIPSASGIATIDTEMQIRDKFMAEDNRFFPMAFLDFKPTGNGSFASNGNRRILFQELDTSDFRPNKIADGNPEWVAIAPSVTVPVRRPDLAIVTLPTLTFDPLDNIYQEQFENAYNSAVNEAEMYLMAGIMEFIKMSIQKNAYARQFFQFTSAKGKLAFAKNLYNLLSSSDVLVRMRQERCMDLKAVIIPLISRWTSYGPWYTSDDTGGNGKVSVIMDQSLVPWNFDRPTSGSPYSNLNIAGAERLERQLSDLVSINTCNITVAGFPEIGLGDKLDSAYGHSNLTRVGVNFGIDGIKTTYDLSSYDYLPGTYRKSDFDDVSRARIDTKPKLPERANYNVTNMYSGVRYGLTVNDFPK